MMKVLNTFQHKEFEKRMAEQKKLRYPNFKQGIADILARDYDVDYEEALRLAFMPEIDKEIMDDVAWAQHMGTEYWAEVIVHNHL